MALGPTDNIDNGNIKIKFLTSHCGIVDHVVIFTRDFKWPDICSSNHIIGAFFTPAYCMEMT